jgi:sialic acid synthase SpsE
MSRDLPAIAIDGRRIARDVPPFVIAEIGLNHGGSVDVALELVDAAAAAGAHAVKLQTLVAAELIAESCPAPAHVDASSLVDFFRGFEIDEAGHREVVARARARGLRVLSTPLSERSVDLLERLGIDAYKIASGDLTWDQLIARVAATGKPIVMSTGMATIGEARTALDVARAAGATDIALLHCVSAYPVPRGSENLRAVQTLATDCGVPVGLSDHGEDTFALPIAVALGASIYERHLVRDDDAGAVDRAVSTTASAFGEVVAAARRAWMALGTGSKACLAAEAVNLTASRRSLCAARDLAAGTILVPGDLIALRPSTGLPPSSLTGVSGRQLHRSLRRGEPVTEHHFTAFRAPEAGCVA